MLNKLLKYEFKNIYKFLSVFYVLCIFFAITTKLLNLVNDTTIMYIISQVSLGCLIAMIANILINTLMRNWVRFNETLYKDESYLTHTLPVEKRTLYTSKFITSITTLFTSFIVIVISLLIAFLTKENFEVFKDFLNFSILESSINWITIIILLSIILYLETYTALQSGFLGIILGHKKNNNKTLWSIIFGFITYIISQTITILIFLIVSLFNNDMSEIFTSNVMTADILITISIVSIITYILITIIIKHIAEKELQKGINID